MFENRRKRDGSLRGSRTVFSLFFYYFAVHSAQRSNDPCVASGRSFALRIVPGKDVTTVQWEMQENRFRLLYNSRGGRRGIIIGPPDETFALPPPYAPPFPKTRRADFRGKILEPIAALVWIQERRNKSVENINAPCDFCLSLSASRAAMKCLQYARAHINTCCARTIDTHTRAQQYRYIVFPLIILQRNRRLFK